MCIRDSGGAGFIELYAVNSMIFDLDTFHILTADVEDTVHIRFKERSGIVMGHRFHFALILSLIHIYISMKYAEIPQTVICRFSGSAIKYWQDFCTVRS